MALVACFAPGGVFCVGVGVGAGVGGGPAAAAGPGAGAGAGSGESSARAVSSSGGSPFFTASFFSAEPVNPARVRVSSELSIEYKIESAARPGTEHKIDIAAAIKK